DHASIAKSIMLAAGKANDLGSLVLHTTDIGYYIGKPAPKGGPLPWEKDFHAAMKRAEAEKKPVLVMMTASWCGWCKKLEADTLDDPWVRHVLSNVIIVKAYEDKEVETKYPQNGYPTLVFITPEGKEMHRIVGYKQSIPFLAECAKAFGKLSM